jgi:arabinogalactan oligomer/maltooligosaccharide transport system substrate-binding protein
MRRLSIIATALLALTAACADGSTTSESSTTTTSLVVTTTTTTPTTTSMVAPPPAEVAAIVVWAPAAAVTDIETAGAAFESETGIAVEVVPTDTETVLASLREDPAAGPHVFIGPHTWAAELTDLGIAEPLTPRSELVAGALDAVIVRGVAVAAPIGLDTTVQFRNPAAMAIAPADVESLSTGCPNGDGVGPCLLIPLDSVEGHYPFLTALGGYVFGPDPYAGWDVSNVGVDGDAAVAGMTILESLVDGGSTVGDGSSSVEQRFIDGTAPLLWGGLDSLETIAENGGRYVVEPLPTIGGQPAPVLVAVSAAWVNAFAPGKDAAAAFVTDFLAAPGTGDSLAVSLGLAPVNIGFDADEDLAAFLQAARTGHPVPTVFQKDYAWEQLAAAFSQIRSGDDVAGALLDAAVDIRNAPAPGDDA